MEFPSKYVGILEEVGTFRNGALPAAETDYSGHWQWIPAGQTVLEGDYRLGIPCGMWYFYYCNKVPKISAEYDGAGNYTAVFCFPDGMPRQTVSGRYEFRDGRYALRNLAYKFRNFSGDALTFHRDRPPVHTGWQGVYSRIPLELPCRCRAAGTSCSAFFMTADAHALLALYWLGSSAKPPGGLAVRTDFLLRIDRVTGELAECGKLSAGKGGHFALHGARRQEDRLRMNFLLPCAAAEAAVEVDFPLDYLR